ncbi:MAG TPA: LamG domain-containing protein, partial [Planctomycetota bacterium]|nr:LamG domain-containing protein [Planctomycetota bacterium]
TSFVEVAEASSSSLAALARDRLDPRTLALFCLIEGHSEAAKSHLKTLDEVPDRYWAWAKVARSRAQRPEIDEDTRRRDRNARDLYVTAEREYRAMATRPMAVQRYRSLVKDYSETELVRRAMGRISRRTEGCSEYLLTAADALGGGTFRKGERPGIGACFISQAESDFTRAYDNFVEFEFGVMERESYRCWAQVGACCQETFQAFYQATELVVTHPRKPKEKVAAEPGSIFAITIATPSAVLPALHSVHGGAKEPTVWGWIELPLPRFPTPGAKHLRLVTAQQGFAVARLLVSTTRADRPREGDLKSLLEGREPEIRTLPPPLGEPGLVGWWTFDEGAGDLSGNGHDATVPLDSSWEPGRVGRALWLKGGSGATVRDAPLLRMAGDLTIVFWVRPDLGSGERTLLVGKGENYGVWIVPGGRIVFEQLDPAGRPVLSVSPQKPLETGRWTHVAAIVRGGHGSVYLDGTAEAARVRTGIPGLSEAPLVFGAAFTGLLDEVRIFSKALGSDELARQAAR